MKVFNAIAAAALLAAVLCLAGCASGQAPDGSSSSSSSSSASTSSTETIAGTDISVGVTVTGPDDAVMFERAEVEIAEGGTALDALKATGLEISVTDSSYGPFVEVIGDVANEGSAGWTYRVNGEMPSVSAGSCTLSAGDEVAWEYATA